MSIVRFGEIRDLIYCECTIVKGKRNYYGIHTHEPTPFDNDIVIGIRHNLSHIIISLKENK